MIEIWLADWVFTYKQNLKEKFSNKPKRFYVVKSVVTKKIPKIFLINEGKLDCIKRVSSLKNVETDFSVNYIKKIGHVN